MSCALADVLKTVPALKLARESSGRKLLDPFSRTTISPRPERTVAEMDRVMPSQQPPRESAET